MKTKIITIALIAILSISNHLIAQEGVLVAQEPAVNTEGSDLAKNIKYRVIPTETGFSIEFEHHAKVPVDNVDKSAAGKKGYDYYKAVSEYSVNSSDNTITEIKSPRDAASGMATGKRQHKPIGVTSAIDKSTPILYKTVSSTEITADESSAPGTGGGAAGKAVFKELTITRSCGNIPAKFKVEKGEGLIPTGDCPNGDSALKITWTWNVDSASAEIGSSGMDGVSRYSVDFVLHIEDGGCTAMAINEKGLPGETKPKKTKSKS